MFHTSKRILAALLCAMLLLCAGCAGKGGESTEAQSSAGAGWLPYGLQFGQSEAEVREVLKQNGYEMASIDGVTFDVYKTHVGFDWEFLHSEVLSYVGSVGAMEYVEVLANDPDETNRILREGWHNRLHACYPKATFFFDGDHLVELDLDFEDDEAFFSAFILPDCCEGFAEVFGTDGKVEGGWSWQKSVEGLGTVCVTINGEFAGSYEIIIGMDS